jgi:hypothetical protein
VHELHVAATEKLQRIRDIRLDGFQIAHLIHRHYERRPSPSREGPNPPPAVRGGGISELVGDAKVRAQIIDYLRSVEKVVPK